MSVQELVPPEHVSKKLRNNYHIKSIKTLEEFAIRAKEFIDMEKANMMSCIHGTRGEKGLIGPNYLLI